MVHEITAEDVRNPKSGRRYKCPRCGSSDGVSMGWKGDKFVASCHARDKTCAVYEYIKDRGWLPNMPTHQQRNPKEAAEYERYDEECRRKNALVICRAALTYGTKPTEYFKRRGLKCPPNARLLPADKAIKLMDCRDRDKHLLPRKPILVFAVGSAKGFHASHCTILNNDATAKNNPKGSRIVHGLKSGGFILLGEVDPNGACVVGEGVETTLSAMKYSGLPGVAALDAGNFCNVALPDCKEVLIARDRGTAGRKAAEALRSRYRMFKDAVAITVPPKGSKDFNDAVKNGVDAELIARRMMAALNKARREKSDQPKFVFSAPEFKVAVQAMPPVKYLMRPIFRVPGRSMLSARAGHLKTRLAMSIAQAIATGTNLMGWTVDEPHRVLYVDAELDPQTLDEWLDRLGPRSENLMILNDKLLAHLGYEQRVSMVTEDERAFLSAMVAQFNPEFIVLDSLHELAPPEMSNDKATEGSWPAVDEWIDRHVTEGRHCLLLHHNNKSGDQWGSVHKERTFDMRMQTVLREDESDDDHYAVQLSFPKPRHLKPTESATRIIRVTVEGLMEWERTNIEVNKAKGKAARDERIRADREDGETYAELAQKYKLSSRSIIRICNKEEE
jgi:hypothetical protein